MPPDAAHPAGLTGLITVATAPVVLITATAILLSGYTGKYGDIADRVRSLAAEFRREGTQEERCDNIRRQLALFRRRAHAMWAASACLSLALLSFVGTVLSVIFVQRSAGLSLVGAATMIIGLVLVGAAVTFDMTEVYLGRLTMDGELEDVFSLPEG